MRRAAASGWRLGAGLLLATALACLPPGGDQPPLPASGRHRVQASGAAADALVLRGATLVADYGTFRILDATPAALERLPPDASVEYRNDYLRLSLNSGDLDTSVPERATALRVAAVGAAGKALHLVQFAGPVRPEWLARLESTGARVVSYAPANGYLVYGDAPALEGLGPLRAAREVQFDGPYLPAHKLDRALAVEDTGSYAIQLVEDPAVNAETLALVQSLERRPGTASSALGFVNLVLHADRAAAEAIAARPDVVSVQPWSEPRLLDERQDMIVAGQLAGGLPTGPGYLAWLASKGFTQAQFDASGFGVDLSDSGVDAGSTLPNHFGLYRLGDVTGASRVSYARLEGTGHLGGTLEGCDGHGNLNAHIIGGYSDLSGGVHADAEGFRYGLGVAPFVRMGSSVVFDPRTYTSPDFEDLISRAYADGMRISSNSWGENVSAYTFDCQRYDALVRDAAPDGSAVPQAGNQEMVIVFAAGNAGAAGAGTIGSPGNAKNVISVGASENVRAMGGADRCTFPDTAADAALDVATFSSRGPAADGRVRPDLLAPGTHVTGGVAQAPEQRASPPASATGSQLACYAGDAVCGGVGSAYFPPGQLWYTASSGTSHATPAVAGAAALVRQWFLNEGRPPPSPAMTKAVLMNAARYMSGAGANDPLFSNAQGMGLVDLGAVFDGAPRLLRDQEPDDLFTATGQARVFTNAIADPTRPFRVTLAWTDAPGATFAAAYKNDLDLTVQVGGSTYKGNVFAGATSAAGGVADARNNVESVFLPAGTSGTYTVTVTAASVNSDGVPGNASPLDQDFALVIGNGCATPTPPAPSGVTVGATAQSTLTVSWTPGTAADYLVYRSTPGGPTEHVATVLAPPFVDGGRSGGVTYSYAVRARQGCAVSPPSPAVSATPTGPCLLSPVFAGLASVGTTGDAVCGNSLGWAPARPSCGGAISYDVYRSTTAGLAPGPATRIATGVQATTFVDVGLVGGTTYQYVVRAVETTAQAAVADGNTVQRAAAPFTVSVPLRDDFDLNRPASAPAWWIEQPLAGGDPLTLVAGCRYHSASTAYRFGQALPACGGTYAASTQTQLVLGGDGIVSPQVNGIAIPPGGRATLTFRVAYQLDNGFDGVYLTYSTTGATGTFLPIPDAVTPGSPYVVSGGYDGTVVAAGSRRGWTGSALPPNGALREVVVNLDALAGQTVWLGWRFGSDATGVLEGFYLDDVRLELRDPSCNSCATPSPAAPTGVAAAATAANEITVTWSPNGAASYELYRSEAAGGPWALAGAVAAPPFVDGGRSAGVTYHYVVAARQGCAISAPSAEATATATGACLLPPAFAGLAAASTTGAATCGNALSWAAATPSCGGAVSYEVFRGTTTGFAPGPANRVATGVTATRYVDTADLVGGTTYFYVVRAVETAGGGPIADANTVERSATPALVSVAYADDFDFSRPPGASAYWIEQVLQGADQLQLVKGCRWQSADTAYRFGQAAATCLGTYPSSTVNQLVLGGDGSAGPNGFAIPAGGAGTLTFRLWYRLENLFDGATLTYSTAGPAGPFAQVPDSPSTTAPYIATGGYDQALLPGGPRAWTGVNSGSLANGALKQVVVNLDALAGRTVWFGWRIATDGVSGTPPPGTTYEGLFVDDVTVDARSSACTTASAQPGPAVRIALAGLPASLTADQAVTVSLTALDASGRTATAYAGPAVLSSSDVAAVLPAPVSFTAGVASATVRLRTAGAQTLTATDGANAALGGSASTSVAAAAPAALRFTAAPSTGVAGQALSPAPKVEIRDAFGNLTPSTASVALSLAAGPSGATLSGATLVPAVGGVATFAGVALDKAGPGYVLLASSGTLASSTSTAFAIAAGPATRYAVSGPSAVTVGAEVTYALQALDAFSNPVTGYAGTAAVTSTDPAATLPAAIAFAGGAAVVPVTFRTAGRQTLSFTETAGGATGATVATVETAPAAAGSGGGGGCGYGSNASAGTLLLAVLAMLVRWRRRDASSG